jgi:hypothetical protein
MTTLEDKFGPPAMWRVNSVYDFYTDYAETFEKLSGRTLDPFRGNSLIIVLYNSFYDEALDYSNSAVGDLIDLVDADNENGSSFVLRFFNDNSIKFSTNETQNSLQAGFGISLKTRISTAFMRPGTKAHFLGTLKSNRLSVAAMEGRVQVFDRKNYPCLRTANKQFNKLFRRSK